MPARGEGPERVAEEFLLRVNAGAGPNAFELARRMGLKPLPDNVERAELREDGTLAYRADARHVEQQRWVTQKVAAVLLRQAQLEETAEAIAQTAAALLLPREEFEQQADRADWNLRVLQTLYRNATMGTLGLRIAMLHEAVVTWFDHGNVRWRSVPPAFHNQLLSLTRFEQHLAEIALETDTVLHPAPRVWAFPLNRNLGSVLLVCSAPEVVNRRSE